MEAVVLRGVVARRLKEEASKRGLSPEEYMLEVLTRDLDPKDRAKEYIEAASSLLEEAEEELKKDDLRQAAEKVWGAAALAVKAYALWKEGKRLASHGELWEYKSIMVKDLGDWVGNAWAWATEMHVCFYEGWCSRDDVENALKKIGRLVEEVEKRVS